MSTTPTTPTPGPWRPGRKGTVVSDAAVLGMHGANDPEYYGGNMIAESVAQQNVALLAAAPELLENAKKNDDAFTWLAEQMNSITDNAKAWGPDRLAALAQDLRIGIERNQARTRRAIANAEGLL